METVIGGTNSVPSSPAVVVALAVAEVNVSVTVSANVLVADSSDIAVPTAVIQYASLRNASILIYPCQLL